MTTELSRFSRILIGNRPYCDGALDLAFGDCVLRLRTNSELLRDLLCHYFRHVLADPITSPQLELSAFVGPPPDLNLNFRDWPPEPGKSGVKESYAEFDGGRLVRKVRTGMLFLQSETERIAVGPCLKYPNQVINFINIQYMNWLLRRGWLTCHAAGVGLDGRGLAIAGFSGGGKSTLMLELLNDPAVNYLTNDRLFIRREREQIQAVGLPKLPRINPGTIIHNEALHRMLSPQQLESYQRLSARDLWELEEKYDVDVAEIYGQRRITPQAPLSAVLILNWQRNSAAPIEIEAVLLNKRRELLAALMKSPGPFFQDSAGVFLPECSPLDEAAYLHALADLPVYEVRGRLAPAELARQLDARWPGLF